MLFGGCVLISFGMAIGVVCGLLAYASSSSSPSGTPQDQANSPPINNGNNVGKNLRRVASGLEHVIDTAKEKATQFQHKHDVGVGGGSVGGGEGLTQRAVQLR